MRHSVSFIESVETRKKEHSKLVNFSKENINQIELIIAFMWSCFDLMQDRKYEKRAGLEKLDRDISDKAALK